MAKLLGTFRTRACAEDSFFVSLGRFSHEPLPDKVYYKVASEISNPNSSRSDEEEETIAENSALRVMENLQTAQARAFGDFGQYDTDKEYDLTTKSDFGDGKDEEKNTEQN